MKRAHPVIVGAGSWLAGHTRARIIGLAVVWMAAEPGPMWGQWNGMVRFGALVCACNLLAATLAARCANPTQVPKGRHASTCGQAGRTVARPFVEQIAADEGHDAEGGQCDQIVARDFGGHAWAIVAGIAVGLKRGRLR